MPGGRGAEGAVTPRTGVGEATPPGFRIGEAGTEFESDRDLRAGQPLLHSPPTASAWPCGRMRFVQRAAPQPGRPSPFKPTPSLPGSPRPPRAPPPLSSRQSTRRRRACVICATRAGEQRVVRTACGRKATRTPWAESGGRVDRPVNHGRIQTPFLPPRCGNPGTAAPPTPVRGVTAPSAPRPPGIRGGKYIPARPPGGSPCAR